MTLLMVEGLDVRYGKIRAVVGLDLAVNEGEIVTLVGGNGAGKSSTIRAICGVETPAAGRIEFAGRRLDRLPAHRIMALGIAHVPEGRQIFTNMTLRENLLLGAYHRKDRDQVARDIETDLELFPHLQGRLDERAYNLSGGELQMLALLRGLMARPRLLLLDEPSLGLAPLVVKDLFRLIRTLRDRGVTILLVEQNVRQALTVADRGYVMESGRLILSGKAQDLLADGQVAHAYLGVKRQSKHSD
ncbi:MAG: ABC transporter ATP-binding protein [Proteobacteria bacterium]|nr:ABC transporter ATP-binding protein [Pseudomonadota bacterium]